ncbi:MAG: SUMF1/EgtB/PvdO family nonheme iron enzyme [Deltaproteobacteria bacterium]|nr:SUMF1/EgtB/PvdO family nonheme iron enzyme [Deltaproteobacteria bacterium]
MANSSISLKGINQAIADLKYRPGSVKHQVIMAIRDFYSSDESIKKLNSIDIDIMIKSIWDVGDNFSKLKSKKRNFSSLRSSINSDLKKLLKKEKNPENIIIADSNIFDMTQEAKDDLLEFFFEASKKKHPVVQVSVEDAFMYASWIGIRLPTEVEWESAARTDSEYKYTWGNEFNQKALNTEQSGLSDTSPVNKYDTFANESKIIDMLGNVMEWTSDIETPPFKSKQNAKYCIAKCGAWNSRDDVTISSRALFKPGFTSNTIGFRCISEIFL